MTADSEAWLQLLPASMRTHAPEQTTFPVHVPHGASVVVVVEDESGREDFLTQVEDNTPPREVNGVLMGRARFALGQLAPGMYTVRATVEDGTEGSGEVVVTAAQDDEERATAPAGSPEVEGPANDDAARTDGDAGTDGDARTEGEAGASEPAESRMWGISATLYAIRSTQSWGVGDFADLADLAVIVAAAGGDYLLLTPLLRSAQAQVTRLGLTPSRRGGLVIDPIYVRPEDIREVAYLPSSQRTMLDWSSETIRTTNQAAERIDFEEVWEAKRSALEVIYGGQRSPMRQGAFEQFVVAHGRDLAEYVHAAVASESEDAPALFADLCADSTTGAAARREHQDRIEFYLWLQWVAREQLAAAHAAAQRAGMRIGMIHTAPVALDPDLLLEVQPYAGGVFLIDAHGQGLQEAAQVAREQNILLFGDGRQAPTQEHLREAGVIPQTTVWAHAGEGESADIRDLPRRTMVAVTMTQDPPTAGFLAEEHLAVMDQIGVLPGDYEQVRRAERIVRERVLGKVRQAGLIGTGATERQVVEALHSYAALSRARYVTATLSDGVGNRRPFALGGSYPDWTYPYTDGAGAAVLIDDLATNARFSSLAEALNAGVKGA